MELSDLTTLMVAIASDPQKAERMKELQAETNRAQNERAQSALLVEHANQVLAEARKMREEAQAVLTAADLRQSELDAREVNLGCLIAAVNAEKAEWEALRQGVDADHAERAKRLEAIGQDVGKRMIEVVDREAAADQKATAAEKLIGIYEAKHQRLADAMALNVGL